LGDYMKKTLDERISAESSLEQNRKDSMHYLLEATDLETGRGFTRPELEREAGLLMSAGSDTTATALAGTIFYLIHNPAALKIASNEVRNRYASVSDISSDSVNDLIYLRACIDEALRLCPPVPGHLPREVLSGGLVIDGEYFPKGTVVGVSAYAIHHNPDYYPDPFEFRPQRWIENEKAGVTPESVANARAAFCAFSIGQRGCIGKQLAYVELTIALATLLYVYDVRLPSSEKELEAEILNNSRWGRDGAEEYQLMEGFLAWTEGPMMEFRERK
jgi:cytochrome P450